jgi:hypothetical protein
MQMLQRNSAKAEVILKNYYDRDVTEIFSESIGPAAFQKTM